jgi:hypothetical protein
VTISNEAESVWGRLKLSKDESDYKLKVKSQKDNVE